MRLLHRGRVVITAERRLLTVVESTALNQHASVHIVKVADRYYLVGGGSAGVNQIAEVPGEVVEPHIEAHRKALGEQRDAMLRLLQRFRKT